MPLSDPRTILYDENGNLLAVSSSQVISSSQPALIIAGSGSDGLVHYLKVTEDGHLMVSGNLSASVTSSVVFPVSQSVKQVSVSGAFVTSSLASTTAFQILPSNSNRKAITFYVDGRRNFFVGFGTAPTLTLFSAKIIPGGYLESPENFTGTVWVLSTNNDATSYINVTEFYYTS